MKNCICSSPCQADQMSHPTNMDIKHRARRCEPQARGKPSVVCATSGLVPCHPFVYRLALRVAKGGSNMGHVLCPECLLHLHGIQDAGMPCS